MNTTILALATILILVLVGVLIYNYFKVKSLDEIRADVYQAILWAEHRYEHGQNAQKLEYVVQLARSMLPGWLSFFITTENLTKLINIWFAGVKDLLDDGKVSGESSHPPDDTKLAEKTE